MCVSGYKKEGRNMIIILITILSVLFYATRYGQKVAGLVILTQWNYTGCRKILVHPKIKKYRIFIAIGSKVNAYLR